MEERFTPKMFIDWYVSLHGIKVEDIGVAPIVILSWEPDIIKSFAELTIAKTSAHWIYKNRYLFYTGYIQDKRVSFVQSPVGAPATVTMMEELIACGARVFIGIGWAGSLQEAHPLGTIMVPTGCIAEEGTSVHYVDKKAEKLPDNILVELLMSAIVEEGGAPVSGTFWTTDAPFRELNSKVDAYKRQGVLGVDMETSAMYALGMFRKISVCNLLVVSDELCHEWQPGFQSEKRKEASALVVRAILRLLESKNLYCRVGD